MSIAPTNFSELAFLSCLTCFSMACLIVSKKAVHEVFNKFSYFMTTFLQTNQTNQAILVISLDYDGTFDRGKEKIRDWIETYTYEFAKTIIMIGSIRQSRSSDEYNIIMNNNGTVKNIETFAKYYGYEFDPFLMADIFPDRVAGDTYRRWEKHDPKTAKICPRYPEADVLKFIYDRKIPLVHAQMHHIKERFPDKEVQYVLIDDRVDIGEFLTTHILNSVPPRTTFNFVNFNSQNECEPFGPPIVSQASLFNHNWRQNHIQRKNPCYPLI